MVGEVCMAKGAMYGEGACVAGVCMVRGHVCIARGMATAGDGTHSTGMHSCLYRFDDPIT